MYGEIRQESFRQLFDQSEVLAFAKWVITEGYVACTPEQAGSMRNLLEQAFAMLEEAKGEKAQFQEAVARLVTQVFCKQDAEFWFNQVYKDYKRHFKPQRRLERLLPLLSGERVLDLGCGDGLTAAALQERGYQVCLADVLDYRDQAARHLPYTQMAAPDHLSYSDNSFDSALVFAVLHHVEEADLASLLRELRRVARRVIVEEDCYDVPGDLPGLETTLRDDECLVKFVALSLEDQLRYLMFVDYFANAITQGITEMKVPFNFRTVREWQDLFARQGFRVGQTLLLGFQSGFFNRSCHVWFVLDREGV